MVLTIGDYGVPCWQSIRVMTYTSFFNDYYILRGMLLGEIFDVKPVFLDVFVPKTNDIPETKMEIVSCITW